MVEACVAAGLCVHFRSLASSESCFIISFGFKIEIRYPQLQGSTDAKKRLNVWALELDRPHWDPGSAVPWPSEPEPVIQPPEQ